MKSLLESVTTDILSMDDLYAFELAESELIGEITINEGFWDWIKRIWSSIFKSTKKNLKDHDGKYIVDISDIESIKADTFKANRLQVSDMTNKNLDKWLKEIKANDAESSFNKIYKYYKSHSKAYPLVVTLKNNIEDKDSDNVVGFFFLKLIKNDKKKVAFPLKLIFVPELEKYSKKILPEIESLTKELFQKRKGVAFEKDHLKNKHIEDNGYTITYIPEETIPKNQRLSSALIDDIQNNIDSLSVEIIDIGQKDFKEWCLDTDYYKEILKYQKEHNSELIFSIVTKDPENQTNDLTTIGMLFVKDERKEKSNKIILEKISVDEELSDIDIPEDFIKAKIIPAIFTWLKNMKSGKTQISISIDLAEDFDIEEITE